MNELKEILDKYIIGHRKPSISKNTARKMLERDLIAYIQKNAP